EPVVGGYASYVPRDGQMIYESSVRSYEPGHLNMHGLLVLAAAVKYKMSVGIQAITRHNLRLTETFVKGRPASLPIVDPSAMEGRCSIILLKDQTGEVHERITSEGIIAIRRNGNIRISFHYHNTEAEVTKLLQVLEHVC